MASPFTTTDTPIPLKTGEKLTLRVDNTVGAEVLINVNGTCDATHASHYLGAGDAVEIVSRDACVVNVHIKTGAPSIYYYISNLDFRMG